jgi:outer membrane protein OmpA-like peptidoglycan-associated protein
MKKINQTIIPTIGLVFLFSVTLAQVDVKGKVKNQTNSRANQRTDQAIDKGLDKVEEGIKGLFKKKDEPDKNQNQQKDQQQNQQQENQQQVQPVNQKNSVTEMQQATSQDLQAFSQYDFVPGDKIILYEDFSQDAVGDFPALWTTNKSGEVNTLNVAPGNWFNLNATEGNWWFLKQIDFPENYIIEFDVVPKKGAARYAVGLHLYGETNFVEMSHPYDKATSGMVVTVANSEWGVQGLKSGQPKISGNSKLNPVEQEKVNHVIIWVQKRRVRIYHKGAKVLDMPTLLYPDSKFSRLCFELYRGASSSSYISNLKITTASPDIRNKLLTEGKLVTYGIYFDVNKDVVKPESYGTLKDIAKILNEVPDVKVKIVGHTDADGADAANLDLSKRRAASVKAELVKSFAVNGERLITDGLGESQPIAPNDTPVNKALNRRVEFIKL